MTRIYAPEPQDIPIAPELPTLSVLDAALNATIDILHLQHDLAGGQETDTQLAREVVEQAENLRGLVRRYAQAALDE